jgi:peptidoglycan/LPS O-acetylase OafA/YrhL
MIAAPKSINSDHDISGRPPTAIWEKSTRSNINRVGRLIRKNPTGGGLVEMVEPGARARCDSLTALRFVAAVLVFADHSAYVNAFAAGPVKRGYTAAVADAGALGVSFFFVLSGFVLALATPPDDPAPGFWRRRAVKIYPSHLVTLGLWLVLMIGAASAGYQAFPTPGTIVPNALLLHTWWPDYDLMSGGNPVSWSLCCEIACYAAFPLLAGLIRRLRPDRLWCWAGGLVLAIGAVAAIAQFLLPRGPVLPGTAPAGLYQFWLVYQFPPVRALEFALGALVAALVRTGCWPAVPVWLAGLLVALLYPVALRAPFLFGLTSVLVAPVALLIGCAGARDLRGADSPLRRRFPVRLGELSYAFYLTHFMVMILFTGALGRRTFTGPWPFLVLAAELVVCVGVAWLLHRLVERPLVRRWSRPRPRAATEPVTS